MKEVQGLASRDQTAGMSLGISQALDTETGFLIPDTCPLASDPRLLRSAMPINLPPHIRLERFLQDVGAQGWIHGAVVFPAALADVAEKLL